MIYAAQRIAQNRLKRSITSDIVWINPWFDIWFCAEFQRIPHLYFYLLSSWGIPIKLPSSSMAKNNLEGGASEIPMVRLPSLQGVTFVVSMVVFDVSRHGLFGCASVVWSSWEANRLRMTDRRKKSGQYYAFALFNSIWGHSLNMVWPVVETLVLSRAAGMYIINISID